MIYFFIDNFNKKVKFLYELKGIPQIYFVSLL